MVEIGIHASHEQLAPSGALGLARRAQTAGFQAAMCSDHFHPWLTAQGHGGFAWSWLGAALASTSLSFGTVCAPGQRYHPAIIAQATATLAEMFPGRIWLAIGSGENLNEHITGDPWPDKLTRNARLRESADVMRALWKGETVDYVGFVKVKKAKLYTLPPEPPLLLGAALSTQTAEWLGTWADGLIIAGKDVQQIRAQIAAFRGSAGSRKPVFHQLAISYAATDDAALEQARAAWPHCVLDSSSLADLETTADFDRAARNADAEVLKQRLSISSSFEEHLQLIRAIAECGVDRIYLHSLGRNVELFWLDFSARLLNEMRTLG
jgi:coenzyme F420-dependent glucose-6-phosphate dehydrogenase